MIHALLGRKLEMTRVFTEDGTVVPVTVIEAGPCPVVQVKSVARDGYAAYQIGFDRQGKNVKKPLKGHFRAHKIAAHRYLREVPSDTEEPPFATGVRVAATMVEGMVAAGAACSRALNYSSVVVFGGPGVVIDPQGRTAAFEAITEHVLPGRWAESRQPTDKEDAGTRLLALDITEASAKVRTGPPGDDEEDMGLGIWAGVIPLAVTPGTPEPAPDLEPGLELPPSVRNYVQA